MVLVRARVIPGKVLFRTSFPLSFPYLEDDGQITARLESTSNLASTQLSLLPSTLLTYNARFPCPIYSVPGRNSVMNSIYDPNVAWDCMAVDPVLLTRLD